jgi:hypothetical protein
MTPPARDPHAHPSTGRDGLRASLRRTLLVVRKSLLEQARDRFGLALTLLTTPALVAFFRFVYGKGRTPPANGDPCAQLPVLERGLPPLLTFAALVLVFSAAMTVAREVESGAVVRLQMTPLRGAELLGGVSVAQGLLGLASTLLGFSVAVGAGMSTRGPLAAAVLAVVLAGWGCIGMGMVVASRARTVHRSFLLASSVMLLMMLFSGVVFPLPELPLVHVGAVTLEPFDVLPTRHAALALERCILEGAGWGELLPRLSAAALSSAGYFWLGVAMFARVGAGSGRD